ncbi:MAG TPA: indole-3-glycerol-phosphate synthase [Polyangiaceae bacterium]
MSRLADIVATKRREVEALRARPRREAARRDPIDPVQALRRARGEPLRLVAEIKLRSPSAGVLSRALGPGERALAYARAGASMVSVLCDAPYFDGAFAHLAAARGALDAARLRVPLLAKEFVIDEAQIAEARDHGADTVLLIARIVDGSRLRELVGAARAERLEPLVEVFDERELEQALAADARLVGVNARDLDTLVMDAARASRVCAAIPAGVVSIRLSGLRDAADVAGIARTGGDAALVGESLMRDEDPAPRLRSMVEAARLAQPSA